MRRGAGHHLRPDAPRRGAWSSRSALPRVSLQCARHLADARPPSGSIARNSSDWGDSSSAAADARPSRRSPVGRDARLRRGTRGGYSVRAGPVLRASLCRGPGRTAFGGGASTFAPSAPGSRRHPPGAGGRPDARADLDLYDLLERRRRAHRAGRHRRRRADVAPRLRSRAPSQRSARGIGRRVLPGIPDPFRRPNDPLYAVAGPRDPRRRVQGVVVRRYVWCDLWHAEVPRIQSESRVPVLDLDAVQDDQSDSRGEPRLGSRRFWKCSRPRRRRPSGGGSCDDAYRPADHARRVGRRYAELCARQGCASRPTAGRCAGTSPTATSACLRLRMDNSAAALRLWNFLLTEEDRLHRARGRGQADRRHDEGPGHRAGDGLLAARTLVAFYPDGAWWIPCVMEQQRRACWQIADRWASTIRSARCARCSGRSSTEQHFPLPDLLTCSVGATCDDFSAIAQRLAALGHPILWWEMPHRRAPGARRAGRRTARRFPAPGRARSTFVRSRAATASARRWKSYAGQALTDERLAAGHSPAPTRSAGCLAELRRLAFTGRPAARCRPWKC